MGSLSLVVSMKIRALWFVNTNSGTTRVCLIRTGSVLQGSHSSTMLLDLRSAPDLTEFYDFVCRGFLLLLTLWNLYKSEVRRLRHKRVCIHASQDMGRYLEDITI